MDFFVIYEETPMSKIGMRCEFPENLVYQYDSDLLQSKAKLIVHQCYCSSKSKNAKGLAADIFKKFPYSNVYLKREKDSAPGTIEVRGGKGYGRWICAMYSQINPGPPKENTKDSKSKRLEYFGFALEFISKIKNLGSVAFPRYIGCGLGGGDWEDYEKKIISFAESNPDIAVLIVSRGPDPDPERLHAYEESHEISQDFSQDASCDASKYCEEEDANLITRKFLKYLVMKMKKEHLSTFSMSDFQLELEMHGSLFTGSTDTTVDDGANEDDGIPVPQDLSSMTPDTDLLVPKSNACYGNTSLEDYCETNIAYFKGGWDEFFRKELDIDDGSLHEISKFISKESGKAEIFPPLNQIFTAFFRTPLDQVKVVLIGQDPYHDIGQAMGICFSVPEGIAPPQSLKNIYKELVSDGFTVSDTTKGDLTKWCDQGVLMINTALTVRAHEAGSHSKKWIDSGNGFTPNLIKFIAKKCEYVVVILWGGHAQSFAPIFKGENQKKIMSAHPSPLSASKGFYGSKPFSKTNLFLENMGYDPIDWSL